MIENPLSIIVILIIVIVAYIVFLAIIGIGVASKNFKTPWFLLAVGFYAYVGQQIYMKMSLINDVEEFLEIAEHDHSTAQLPALNSLRIGPVDESGNPNFCIEEEGDPAKFGFRFCYLTPRLLISKIVGDGGVFETGNSQVQRWRFVTGSEQCMDDEVSSRDINETYRHHSYSGVTALRGMCYLLDDVDVSSAKYLLTGSVHPLPFKPDRNYFELVLIDQETGETIDRLVDVDISSDIQTSLWQKILTFYLPIPYYRDRILDYSDGPIVQILKFEAPVVSKEPGTGFGPTWVEELSASYPVDDQLVILALERANEDRTNGIYSNLVRQICREWNFIGPDLRDEMDRIAREEKIGRSLESTVQNCGITGCRDRPGQDGLIVACENPRVSVDAASD